MDIKSNFEIYFNKVLDSKEFYTFYKGIDKISKNQIIANKIDFNKESSKEFKNLINKEINNIRIMNLSNNSHHYINHFIENDNLFIVYENYDNNLENLINKSKFSIDKIKDLISQLNNTFKLLFDNNIFHLDIKPSNIFIKKEKNNLNFLLGNYGFYNLKQKSLLNNKNNKDFAYIPPEIRLNSTNDLSKADLWSIGILLYYLYFQHFPFKNEEEYLNYISKNSEKLNIDTNDTDLNDLIEKLIIGDVSKRLSWEDYFNHKFFRSSFGRIYYDNYEIEYEGIFKDYKKYKGKEYDLYGNLEFEGEFNDKEERWNGIIKEFNEKCKLKFEGKYIKGDRVGKEYNDKNELVFEGEYKNGIRWNGKGKEENDQIIFYGNYQNGIRIGKEYYHNNRIKFEGDRNGKGIEYVYVDDKNKEAPKLFQGEYKNNKRWNGEGEDTDIKNGNGIGKEYNINGHLEFQGEYKDGNKFKGIEFSRYKRNKYIDKYKENNIWIGKEYYDYEKGIINFDGEYKNGERWKGKEYHENGNIQFEGEYKNDLRWKGKEFYENGEIKFEGEYIKEYYSEKFWRGVEYKDLKVIATYKNGKESNDNINIEEAKNGIIFEDSKDECNGLGKEYIYDKLIFEGEYINNCRIKGKEYENGNLIFEGEYRNNERWNGKFKFYEKNNLILDGEYRYGNKKYYIYIPFYRNEKEYIIKDKKLNKYNEILYYANDNLVIREISKYDYNMKILKSQLEKDRLLTSINKKSRRYEIFEYKFNYYIVYENDENFKELIDKFKVKLPNDLIYQIIKKMKNIFEIFETNKIFYDLDSENIVYKDTKDINIYLDVDLYIHRSNYYYEKPKLIKSDDNKYNYKAPELYNNIKINNLSKVSIWSLGILLYQMIFHDFPDINYQQKLNKDKLLHNLIIQMLSVSPEKRISLKELNKEPLLDIINILFDKNIKHDGIIKFMFIGESAVGNNSLVNSFENNIPYLSNFAVIGLDFSLKMIYLNGLKIRLQIWHSAGQERFFLMQKNYIKNLDIVILVYDIHDQRSIDELERRYNIIKEDIKNSKNNMICGVCGNKIDKTDGIISGEEERMREFTKKNNLDYYCRTSCKNFEGIEDMFYTLIDLYLKKNNNTLKGGYKSKLNKKAKKKDCNIF